MAGSRTLKLSILGDVDNLNKSLKTAGDDVDSFGDKMGKVGKAVGTAFLAAAAAAGTAAIAIGVESVKAAIADEKAQTQLALALENATGATTAQIAATEQSILKMSLATGVADDQLRPALQRLVLSTGDITKAQDLLTTALDISTATGKPLETVANALGKAYDGNTAALGKLGIGLTSAELKTMTFTEVQGKLTELFGGAAAANAETYAGKIARVQVAFDEAKETLGTALLPILETFLTFINENALPAINAFANAFSMEGNGLGGYLSTVGDVIKKVFSPILEGLVNAFNFVKDAIVKNLGAFTEFGGYIAKYLAPIIGTVLGGALTVVGKIAAGVIDVVGAVITVLNNLISGAITGINALISAYNFVNNIFGGKDVAKISAPSISIPKTTSTTTASKITIPNISGTTSTGVTAASNATAAASAGIIGLNTSSAESRGLSDAANAARLGAGTTINLTVTGAFEPEGTARTIIDTLNNSYYRGTGGGSNLQGVA
jgi:hypothetical protein